jgi:hypothetical protein
MTAAVYTMTGALLVWALIRRPQAIVLALAVEFLLAIAAAHYAPGVHIRPVLLGLDALLVMAVWVLWCIHRSTRAAIVAWLGLSKILFGIAASLSVPYIAWAAGNNAFFIAMILVAGGFADGIIAWVGRGCLVIGHRSVGLLRYIGAIQ